MDGYTHELRTVMVESYPVYVATVLVSRGIEVSDLIADSIVEGAQVLDALFVTLERTSPELQRHSPLELFREALRPVTRVLTALGLPEVARDPEMQTLLPWDKFALSPASTAVIGPDVHQAHLAWGVAKASALGGLVKGPDTDQGPQRPLLWFVCRDGDTDAIVSAGERNGYRLLPAPQWDRPVAVLLDLAVDDATELLGLALHDDHRLIAYDDDIDDVWAVGLRASGVWKVASRDDVLHRLGTILPALG